MLNIIFIRSTFKLNLNYNSALKKSLIRSIAFSPICCKYILVFVSTIIKFLNTVMWSVSLHNHYYYNSGIDKAVLVSIGIRSQHQTITPKFIRALTALVLPSAFEGIVLIIIIVPVYSCN